MNRTDATALVRDIAMLPVLLQLSAAAQLAVALLNLGLARLMDWRKDLARLPLLIREVHQVHSWFISLTLALFAVLTFRFGSELSAGTIPICRWLAAGIAIFWGFRVVLQVAYYSSSHWRGNPRRTVIHLILLLMYGGFTLTYAWAALGGSAW